MVRVVVFLLALLHVVGRYGYQYVSGSPIPPTEEDFRIFSYCPRGSIIPLDPSVKIEGEALIYLDLTATRTFATASLQTTNRAPNAQFPLVLHSLQCQLNQGGAPWRFGNRGLQWQATPSINPPVGSFSGSVFDDRVAIDQFALSLMIMDPNSPSTKLACCNLIPLTRLGYCSAELGDFVSFQPEQWSPSSNSQVDLYSISAEALGGIGTLADLQLTWSGSAQNDQLVAAVHSQSCEVSQGGVVWRNDACAAVGFAENQLSMDVKNGEAVQMMGASFTVDTDAKSIVIYNALDGVRVGCCNVRPTTRMRKGSGQVCTADGGVNPSVTTTTAKPGAVPTSTTTSPPSNSQDVSSPKAKPSNTSTCVQSNVSLVASIVIVVILFITAMS